MIHDRSILLTGGAGFIGTARVRLLLENNRITLFDNGFRNALAGDLPGHRRLRFVGDDVLDAPSVREAIRGCTVVVP